MSGQNNQNAPDRLTPISGDQPIGTDVAGNTIKPTFYFFQTIQRILSYLGQPGQGSTNSAGTTLTVSEQLTNLTNAIESLQSTQGAVAPGIDGRLSSVEALLRSAPWLLPSGSKAHTDQPQVTPPPTKPPFPSLAWLPAAPQYPRVLGVTGPFNASVAASPGTSLSSATPTAITSLALAAGTYLVVGNVGFTAGSGCVPTILTGDISTTSASISTTSPSAFEFDATFATAAQQLLPCGGKIVTLAASGSVYLNISATFSGGTATCFGNLQALPLF